MRRLRRRYEDEDEEKPERESEPADVRTCPECESDTPVKSADGLEVVCERCGLVLEDDALDRGPEWRAFDHQESRAKSRVGAPTTRTIHDKGLTTSIDWRNEDAYGNSLSADTRQQMDRLRTWHKRIRANDAGERNLQFALSEIDRMASALGVPRSVREVACVMYRRALAEDLIRGRSIEGVASGCLYAGCRREDLPRSLTEVSAVSRVDRKEIGRAYRYVVNELSIEMKPTDPKQYVPRFSSELGLSNEAQTKANEVIDAATERGLLSGKSPTGFAAAAIYAASLLCDEKQTQGAVADAAGVTEVTIRNRYQEQIDAMDIRQ